MHKNVRQDQSQEFYEQLFTWGLRRSSTVKETPNIDLQFATASSFVNTGNPSLTVEAMMHFTAEQKMADCFGSNPSAFS